MSARFRWEGGSVSAAWDGIGDTVVVLAHGAGGTLRSLEPTARALAERGLRVARFNFPYSEAGRRSPDRPAVLEACWQAVAEQAREGARRVFLGGRSMGGRIASHVVAAGVPAAGLVFLAYPLHPPGKPERLRDAHLYGIDAPMLFVQGSRDSFARPDLLAGVLGTLGAKATLHTLEGADHGYKAPGRPPSQIVEEVAEATSSWIASR